MKKAMSKQGSSIFFIVLIAIGLIILFGCIFGFFCWKTSQKEKFLNGCASYKNYEFCIPQTNYGDKWKDNKLFEVFELKNLKNIALSMNSQLDKDAELLDRINRKSEIVNRNINKMNKEINLIFCKELNVFRYYSAND